MGDRMDHTHNASISQPHNASTCRANVGESIFV